MRHVLTLLAGLALLPSVGASQVAPPDSSWLRRDDTVRVWSRSLNVKGTRGVVTRAEVDTLGFIAPAGFRKLPREYVGNVASIQRIEVLEGTDRSGWRFLRETALGGVLGTVAGALLGVVAGTVIYEANRESYENNEGNMDSRGLAQLMLGAMGGIAGGTLGLIGGGIHGARPHERWRRVR